ncbi:MAG: FAD:protein FMN transferase [Candidatus Dormibacteria bacterium]
MRLQPAPDPGPRIAVPQQLAGRTFQGFGSLIGVWTTEPTLLEHLEAFLRSWVARVDAGCNRFAADSDLSRANANAGSAVVVGPELLGAVRAACAMAEFTDGLYDPTVGAAVVNAGYDRSFELIRSEGPGPLGPACGGAWWRVDVDALASTLTVPAGFRLDLGGSAKGWAVDVALAGLRESILADHPEVGVCISAGGDLGVAGAMPAGGWPVTISERLDGNLGVLGTGIMLRRGALATSGASVRSWGSGPEAGHHVIDPRSGRPGKSRWAIVSVFAESCLVADAAATAVWLLDGDAPDWVEGVGLCARLVDREGRSVIVGDRCEAYDARYT